MGHGSLKETDLNKKGHRYMAGIFTAHGHQYLYSFPGSPKTIYKKIGVHQRLFF